MSIGVPARRSTSLISVVASTAAQSRGQNGTQNASTNCSRGGEAFRTCGAKAHLGVSDNRDHDTLVTQHRRLQALQHYFRLLAHDERADVGVEHVDLVHRSNRPSSLTTSPRSTIKSGSAFSSCANEHRGRPDGTQDDTVPSRTIFSSLTPSKSRSRGRRMVLRKTSGNVGVGSG